MKKTQQIPAVLFALLAMFLCFVFCASAQDAKSGSCGEALQWTLEDGTLTVSGTGEMADYSRDQAPWAAQTVTRVIVEEGVSSISENAFRLHFSLEQVTLPASLRSIGKTAFWQCVSLQKAELAEGLQTIGAQAFKGCKALQEITLPQSLESIGDEAFSGCEALPLLSLGPKMKTVPGLSKRFLTKLSAMRGSGLEKKSALMKIMCFERLTQGNIGQRIFPVRT